MKYAKEVIGLLAAFPGCGFKMQEIVCEISKGRKIDVREYQRMRNGVARILHDLEQRGLVRVFRLGQRKSAAYLWRKNPTQPKTPQRTASSDFRQISLF